LVDLSNDAVNSTLDLKAYNSGQVFGFPGGEPNSSGPVGSLLNNIDFNLLHINVSAATNNPITAVPSTLANNTYWTAGNATVTRTVNVTGGQPNQPNNPFSLDNTPFTYSFINKTVNLDAVEEWTIVNNNVFSHAFHIHDVEFKIVARNGNPNAVGAYESGWKDVVELPVNESVSFVAKFSDYADAVHPFMYHCHFSNHEDGGMMGQFVVTSASGISDEQKTIVNFLLFPNPAQEKIFVQLEDPAVEVYYITVTNIAGKAVMMLPQPELQKGIDISRLAAGTYFVRLMDMKTKSISVQRFVKE
jgi:hypothetical protein